MIDRIVRALLLVASVVLFHEVRELRRQLEQSQTPVTIPIKTQLSIVTTPSD